MKRRDFLALGTAFAASPIVARASTTSPSDMDIFRAAMAIHPGLYRYNSPADIAERLDRLDSDYTKTASLQARYLLLSTFLATLKCGHSYCNFFNQNDPAVLGLFDRPTRLPFYFDWIGGEMIVTKDHTGTGQLPAGTRITAINGILAQQMLKGLLPISRADGANDGKRLAMLSVGGMETIEFFDVFQGLLFPPVGPGHVVDIVRPDGQAAKLDLPAHTLAQRQAVMTRAPETGDQPRWTWTMTPDGVAVLDMPGWAMWNSQWDWRTWLDDRLDSLKGAKALIVDLRQNEGGDDCGDPILSRLIDAPIDTFDFVQKVRFETVPDILAPHVSTWDDSFRTIGVGGRKLDDGFIERPDKDRVPLLQPSTKRLDVPVVALIGPTNSSATFAFLHAAQSVGKITMFGAQTGGNRRGLNGGGFFFTKLPQSGIEFDLPLIGYFSRTPQPDSGILPDVNVVRTADDIAQGRDPAMAAAVAWLMARG